jgi:hypothetical protein
MLLPSYGESKSKKLAAVVKSANAKKNTSNLAFPQTCMTANFYDGACDHPNDSFEKITRRLLGIKGFTDKSVAFKQDCRKSFDMGRQK